jgi:hypothetical protein
MAMPSTSTANYRLFQTQKKRWSSISLPEITDFYLSLLSLIPRGSQKSYYPFISDYSLSTRAFRNLQAIDYSHLQSFRIPVQNLTLFTLSSDLQKGKLNFAITMILLAMFSIP